MTPVAFLAAFCTVLAVAAVVRLGVDEEREPIDAGTALLVSAVAVLTIAWAGIRESWFSPSLSALVSVVGVLGVGSGLVLLARRW